MIERKHKQFKEGMPDNFNELLFERLQRITRRYEPDLEEAPNTFQEEQSRSRIVDLQQEGFRIQGKTTDHHYHYVLEADPKGNAQLTIWAIESRNFICQGLDCKVAPPLLTINKEMRMEAVKRALEV